MATDRTARFAVPVAAAFLLWPALWNGFPIVFADTGTYLSQAIYHYAGWDRPVFYSLAMLPLHATVTLWPVVAAQALLAAWVLWLVSRVLLPGISAIAFTGGILVMSICTWLPWLASELMPDLFTPLLVLVLCLLAWVPELLSRSERIVLVGLATFLIATQQSSLPLACVLGVALGCARILVPGCARILSVANGPLHFTRHGRAGPGHLPPPGGVCADGRDTPRSRARSPGHDSERVILHQTRLTRTTTMTGKPPPLRHPWLLTAIPPALAVLALCTVNFAAHGRFAVSPYGNVFLLARVIYDGPGMTVLRRDCPASGWHLCPYLDHFPPTSDDFLWSPNSPLNPIGGPKIVSADADAIIRAAVLTDPIGEIRNAATNTLAQLAMFASGDGLTPWPEQVSPVITRDFPLREQATYAAARQQTGSLSVPPVLALIHEIIAVTGVITCALLLPLAFRSRAACAGFLLAVLLALPLSAAITGGLSAPHDRYQARIMWLPPFVVAISLASLRRRPA